MSKFKLGDEVTLREDSEWNCEEYSSGNPFGVKGVVQEIREGDPMNIVLVWDNGCTNTYSDKDLDFWEEDNGVPMQEPSETPPVGKIKSTGDSSSYYDLNVSDDLLHRLNTRSEEGRCYIKTEEIIHYLLDDSFPFGTAFKSLVRALQETRGSGKEGNDLNYECNKIKYYADSIVEYYGGEDETYK